MRSPINHKVNDHIILAKQENEIVFSGSLTQATVMNCLFQCEKLFTNSNEIRLNLSEISHCDSASLAFLTAALRLSKQLGVNLKIAGMPTQMRDLASVSGLLPLLPLLET